MAETSKIRVKIKPGSKEQKIKILKDMFGSEIYEIRVKELPIEGKANKELIEILANHFEVAKNKVEIKSGITSRSKIVLIHKV